MIHLIFLGGGLLLFAAGVAFTYAVPLLYVLRHSRPLDLILGILIAEMLGIATFGLFGSEPTGPLLLGGMLVTFAFGVAIATLVRSVIRFVRE
jgi:hypothetical protein